MSFKLNKNFSGAATGPTIKGALALDEMEIPAVDPADPRGLIKAAFMLAPLEVRIKQWDPPPEPLDTPHTLTLHWLRGGVQVFSTDKVVIAPPPDLPDEHILYIPLPVLRAQSGPVEMYYSITDSFDGVSELVPRKQLTIDMDSPQLLNPADHLEFLVPPSPVVDETYLIANDPVGLTVPPYTGRDDGDDVHFYVSNDPNPPEGSEAGVYELASATDPLIAYLDADVFRTLTNGPAYLFHRIFDEAGNYSIRSAGLPFTLSLIPSPGTRPPPEIFPAERYSDDLINRADARAGIFVRVNPYLNWDPRDRVIVYWKGRPTPIQDVTSFPTDVPIDWAVLRGPLTEPLVPETVPVRYEIIRFGLPPFPSINIRVNQNLTIAGQDHGNAPAVLNLDLPVAEVWGLVSNTRNVVNHSDNPAGARARVRLYDNPVAGQILRFFWNGVGPIASYTVQPGDTAGQLVFSSVIPWAVMAGIIHPELPVYYTTDNGVNIQQSDNALVNVNTGALIQFPMPVLKHTLVGGAGKLSCCSKPEIFYGVTWHVVPDDRFELGDVVHFRWAGFDNNNWSPPFITESIYTENRSFDTDTDLENGLSFIVQPYEDKVVPMRDSGTAQAWYEVRRNGALIGESPPKRIRVDLLYPQVGYCKAGDVISCTSDGVATLIKR